MSGGGATAMVAARGRGTRSLWWLGAVALAVSVVLVGRALDFDALAVTWRAALAHPVVIALVVAAYLAAFVLRAMMWTAVLPELPFGHALAGIHLSLAGNHV